MLIGPKFPRGRGSIGTRPAPFKNSIFRRNVGSMDVAQPPPHLSSSSAEWWRTTLESYVLEPHHLKLLQLACEAWDRCQQARQILEDEGLTVQTEGGIQQHPAISSSATGSLCPLIRELVWIPSRPRRAHCPAYPVFKSRHQPCR
jgi:phage terminase small subunit